MKPLDLDSKHVVIGRFGAPHGVKGWIKLQSFTESEDDILQYHPWHVQRKGFLGVELLEYEKVEFHAKGMIVLLKGINDRNKVMTYTQGEISVPRSLLPELIENEHYWSDLEGLTVITQEGITLGQVDHLFETGSNDVLVVKGEREHLIPYLRENTVLDIDLVRRVMTVNWDPEF